MNLKAKLALAPSPLAFGALLWYFLLWANGVAHTLAIVGLADILRADALRLRVLQLCVLYSLESALALIWGRSTLAGWRPIDFLLHHIPYAVVVVAADFFKVPIFQAYSRTLPLTLLTSMNEAVTVGLSLGLPRSLDRPNRLYLLLLMVALIIDEIF